MPSPHVSDTCRQKTEAAEDRSSRRQVRGVSVPAAEGVPVPAAAAEEFQFQAAEESSLVGLQEVAAPGQVQAGPVAPVYLALYWGCGMGQQGVQGGEVVEAGHDQDSHK